MDFAEGVSVRYVVALAVAVLGAVAGILPAEARRVALVIGNAEYKIGPLANPVHDAAAVAEALEKRLKFDTVLLRPNLSLDGFRAALREMAAQSRGAELGVVFFAGHGIETGGRNYLIPTDAALAASADIELEAIALDTVLRQLEGVTRLRLVILDACRHNPFPAATRGVRGLVRIEPDLGTLVAYAAKDGTVADDGKGRHSPFTAALLKRIVAPGLDVRRVFGYVSEDVMAATGRRQQPYLYGRLGGDEVYLMGSDPAGLTPGHAGPAPKPPPQSSEAERAWAAVKDSTSIPVLEAFRRQYGATNAFYDRLTEARIEELRKQQMAIAKIEEDRKRSDEARRRAEAERERLLEASKPSDFGLDAQRGRVTERSIPHYAQWTNMRATVSLVAERPNLPQASECKLIIADDDQATWVGLSLRKWPDGRVYLEGHSRAGGPITNWLLDRNVRFEVGQEVMVHLDWASAGVVRVLVGGNVYVLPRDWSSVNLRAEAWSANCRFGSIRFGP